MMNDECQQNQEIYVLMRSKVADSLVFNSQVDLPKPFATRSESATAHSATWRTRSAGQHPWPTRPLPSLGKMTIIAPGIFSPDHSPLYHSPTASLRRGEIRLRLGSGTRLLETTRARLFEKGERCLL